MAKRGVTEAQIKDTAKQVFFGQGRYGARLHEIAAAAGVNKALVHYYFRDRETLFAAVFTEALEESFLAMFRCFSQGSTFEQKVSLAVETITERLMVYPFMESFIIAELNKAGAGNAQGKLIEAARAFTNAFRTEATAYLAMRSISNISADQLLVNMMALCAYPFSTKPIISSVLGMNPDEYRQFMAERKKHLVQMILMDPD